MRTVLKQYVSSLSHAYNHVSDLRNFPQCTGVKPNTFFNLNLVPGLLKTIEEERGKGRSQKRREVRELFILILWPL